jgi:hypothetical protein
MSLRVRRSNGVAEIVCHVTARHAHLARQRGNGARFIGQEIDQLLAERHLFGPPSQVAPTTDYLEDRFVYGPILYIGRCL